MENIKDKIVQLVSENLTSVECDAIKQIIHEHDSFKESNKKFVENISYLEEKIEDLQRKNRELNDELADKIYFNEKKFELKTKEAELSIREECAEKRISDMKYLVETVFKSKKVIRVDEEGYTPIARRDASGYEYVEDHRTTNTKTIQEEE